MDPKKYLDPPPKLEVGDWVKFECMIQDPLDNVIWGVVESLRSPTSGYVAQVRIDKDSPQGGGLIRLRTNYIIEHKPKAQQKFLEPLHFGGWMEFVELTRQQIAESIPTQTRSESKMIFNVYITKEVTKHNKDTGESTKVIRMLASKEGIVASGNSQALLVAGRAIPTSVTDDDLSNAAVTIQTVG